MNVQHYKDNIYITGQVLPENVEALVKDYGLSVIVNNRIDGEEANQPESDAVKSVCEKNGVEYQYLPMRDRQDISEEAIATRNDILQNHQSGNILFFCRTGGRCEALLSHE